MCRSTSIGLTAIPEHLGGFHTLAQTKRSRPQGHNLTPNVAASLYRAKCRAPSALLLPERSGATGGDRRWAPTLPPGGQQRPPAPPRLLHAVLLRREARPAEKAGGNI